MNSKDYIAAGDHLSKATDLAVRSGDKDNLFDVYEMRANLETQRGNLSAASDYLDRALSMSADIKDRSLLHYGYTDRADIYYGRADQCDFDRQFEFCKKVFDMGQDDTRKAMEVAKQAGWEFLRQQSQNFLDQRQAMADQLAKIAATYGELAKMDTSITKASQVILVPRFSSGPNALLTAELKKSLHAALDTVNAYDPMKAYQEGQLEEWEGNDAGALPKYLQAVKLLESDRRKLGDTAGSGSFLGDRIEIYYGAALQHLDRKQYPQAFDLLERSRARAMAELLASRNLSFRAPELQNLFSQSVDLRAQFGKAQNNLFDALGSKAPDTDVVKDLQAKVDTLEAQDRALQAKIQQQRRNSRIWETSRRSRYKARKPPPGRAITTCCTTCPCPTVR